MRSRRGFQKGNVCLRARKALQLRVLAIWQHCMVARMGTFFEKGIPICKQCSGTNGCIRISRFPLAVIPERRVARKICWALFLFPVSLLLLNVLHSNDEQSVHLRVGAGCVLIPLQRMPRQERVDEITKAERVHLGLRPRVSPDALANPLCDSRAEGAYPVPGNGGPIIAMLLQACAAKFHGDDSSLSVPPNACLGAFGLKEVRKVEAQTHSSALFE